MGNLKYTTILIIHCIEIILLIEHCLLESTWNDAQHECGANGSKLLQLPVSAEQQQMVFQAMSKLRLSESWIDLRMRSQIRWVNGTKFGGAAAQESGDCGAIREKRFYLFNCTTKRQFVCSNRSSNEGLSCSNKRLSWADADEYCKRQSGMLIQCIQLKTSPCNFSASGFWIGLSRQYEILPDQIAKDKPCSPHESFVGERCGIIEKTRDSLHCHLVLCNNTYPLVCSASSSHKQSGQILIYYITVIIGIGIVISVLILGVLVTRRYNRVKRYRLQMLRDAHPYQSAYLRAASPSNALGAVGTATSSGALYPVYYSPPPECPSTPGTPDAETDSNKHYSDISVPDSIDRSTGMPVFRSSTYDSTSVESGPSDTNRKAYQNVDRKPAKPQRRVVPSGEERGHAQGPCVGRANKQSPAHNRLVGPETTEKFTQRQNFVVHEKQVLSQIRPHLSVTQDDINKRDPSNVQDFGINEITSDGRYLTDKQKSVPIEDKIKQVHTVYNSDKQTSEPVRKYRHAYENTFDPPNKPIRPTGVRPYCHGDVPVPYASVCKFRESPLDGSIPSRSASLGASAYFASDESD